MIPSLLQIPSAVSDSKLHSVLPNNGKGDFQFERSTGATRINRDGLIEEVGYFSSELVQNGDFSELGSELASQPVNLTNDFLANSGGVIVDADTFTTTGSSLDGIKSNTSVFSLTVGKTYKIDIQGNTTSSGFTLGNISASGNEYGSGFGTHYFVSENTQLWIRQNTAGTTNITSFSVKQVDPNDRWVLGTGFSFGNNVINRVSSGVGSNLYQNTGSLAGKKVKYSFTVTNFTSGRIDTSFFGASGTTVHRVEANGDYSFIIDVQAGHNGNTGFSTNNTFTATISNISVVEVQGDRPRLSYDITNGVVEDKPHLLLEPSSTNLVTFSEDFSQTDWIKTGASININQIISPNGSLSADELAEGSGNGTHYVYDGAGTIGNVETLSVFAKKNTRSFIALQGGNSSCYYGLEDGTVSNETNSTGKIEDFGNDWFRCSMTFTRASNTNNYIYVAISQGQAFYQGDGSSSVYIWGAQLEQQSYATSYIPTAGTTITRAAETCNNSKPSVNSTEGVLFVDYASLSNSGNYRMITLSDGTTSNRIFIAFRQNTGYIYYFVIVGGSTSASYITSTTSLNFSKVALKWKANDFAFYVNGTLVHTDTSGSTFSAGTLTTLQFNEGDGAAFEFYGKIKGLAVYNEALTDAQLIELTS